MNEQISALLDDEIAADEASHIIASVQSHKGAALAWQHYHLIGDAMRGDAILSEQFKQNLMQKLDAEPTVLAPNMQKISQQTSNETASHDQAKSGLSTRWSIAASFAAVVVVSYMALQTMGESSNTTNAFASNDQEAMSIAQVNSAQEDNLPLEYLMAHQAASPSASSYYVQTTSYSE